MSAKKKRQDAFKAKEKKQKIIAAVGGVLLLGLLAFQVPRVMKQMHRGSAQAAVPKTVSTPTSTTPTLAAPTTLRGDESSGTSSRPGGSTSSSGLITSSGGDATSGQLASFSRFESKDPFSQQVKTSTTSDGSSSGSGSGGGTAGGTAGGSGSGSGSDSGAGSGSGSSGSGSTATQPAPGSAVVSVNGTLMTVSVGTDFPQPSTSDPNATPLFHLVSLTATTAKIAIAGGSYTSGASTVTLRVNKPVTLMNTADGSRYKLILKPQGTPVPGEAGATSTTPTVTLPAPSP
jgi:hypothetical protein